MYTYFTHTNSINKLEEPLLSRIKLELKKLQIDGKIINFEAEKELYQKLLQLDKDQTNTLVLIGDDADFEMFISQFGKLNDDLAVGFIPINKSKLSSSLNIKDWLSAIEALAKRKIKETSLHSVSNRYFLNNLKFEFDITEKKKQSIHIIADGKLSLKLPPAEIIIENLHEEQFRAKNPLVISGYRLPGEHDDITKSNIFGFIKKQIKQESESNLEQILHLPLKFCKISFVGNAKDSLGRNYNKPIIIGRSKKMVRLITKKGNDS